MEYTNILQNDIRFLGVNGSKEKDLGTTCLQVSKNILIDAGNILSSLGNEAYMIEHIFLTHSHLDHIVDIAFFIDNFYQSMKKPLKIYGLKETITALKNHLFNDQIWPDFTKIHLPNSDLKTIEFIELQLNKEYIFEDVTLTPLEAFHSVPTCSYIIKKPSFSTIFLTDTHITRSIREKIILDQDIQSLIVDVSFPSSMEKLAYKSLHLTPKLLEQELEIIGRDLEIFITHIKPSMQNIIEKELKLLNLLKGKSRVLKAGEFLKNRTNHPNSKTNFMDISKALSKEKDLSKILEMILIEAISYTNCEGGTIYLKENNELHFKTIINKKLDIHINNLKYPTIPLFINGKENKENVSATSVIQKKSINIPDVYICNYNGLSFEGVKKFDKANKYRTKSMLVIPMINQDDEVIGVLQLINKKLNDSYIQFDQDDIDMTTTYTNWAASAITKDRLVDDLEALLLSFLESISIAISEKSTYGYEHIQRVAQLMKIVSGKINEDKTLFKDINYTKEQLKELEIAAWMHDIGKIATPEYIIDKATKLETISDRIEHIKTRFDYIKSALKAQMLEQKMELLEKHTSAKEIAELENSYQKEIELLNSDIDFLQRANQPKFGILSEEDIKRIESIAKRTYHIDQKEIVLLSEDERKNLSIVSGSLTQEERQIITDHAKISKKMLNMLTFPKKYSRVKEIAASHHEKLNGKGYPDGLSADELSFEARLMAILDIFEALTAKDRPYKKPKTIKETFSILEDMAAKNELDANIIKFLKQTKAYEPFAKKYMDKEQYEEALALES